MRTPKKLLVFRNGDPSVKYTVVLDKRSTPTFESILEYISDLMRFPVVKLHTADGRRVSVNTTHEIQYTKRKKVKLNHSLNMVFIKHGANKIN